MQRRDGIMSEYQVKETCPAHAYGVRARGCAASAPKGSRLLVRSHRNRSLRAHILRARSSAYLAAGCRLGRQGSRGIALAGRKRLAQRLLVRQ